MGKEFEFDAMSAVIAAMSQAKLTAAKGVKKAKSAGGISAVAPSLAKDVALAYDDGSEAGVRRAYLTVCSTSKALAMLGEGVFDLDQREHGPALTPQEKRALYEEVKVLVDDRLDKVILAALTIGEFHLDEQNIPGLVKELKRDESIVKSLALFGPAAMETVKAKPKMKAK